MPSNSPIGSKLLKGALIEFSNRFIIPVPNIILFQYNPESMTRKLEAWYAGSENDHNAGGKEPVNAQPHDPPESFDVKLEFDAMDDLSNPVSQAMAVVTGVANRIAALEMLLYPQEESKGTTPSAASTVSGNGNGQSATQTSSSTPIPRGSVPDLLFCWGPSRIVPVRLTSFSVEEQAYSALLVPIRAKVSVGMKIIQPRNLPCSKDQSSEIVKTAYNSYKKLKQQLAAANMVGQAGDTILGMLPI